MSAVHQHYLVIVGNVCDAARLAHLPVRIKTRDGRSVLGVPETELARADDDDQVDHTGYGNRLVVAGVSLALDQVFEVRVAAPEP